MKKTILSLLFVAVFGSIQAQQNEYPERIQAVEKQIAEYTKAKLPAFEIPAKDLAQIKKSIALENQPPTEDELQKSLLEYKKYLLRVDFFKQYPV